MRLVKVMRVILVFALTATVSASVRDIQIYAMIESVEFEPSELAPQRIRIYGAFAFLSTNQQPTAALRPGPYAPERGYLYFKLPEAKTVQTAAKKEWADLKALAGTGQAITFGSWTSGYWGISSYTERRNGFVAPSKSGEALLVYTKADGSTQPITYTMDTGIVKLSKTGPYSALVQQLKDTLKKP